MIEHCRQLFKRKGNRNDAVAFRLLAMNYSPWLSGDYRASSNTLGLKYTNFLFDIIGDNSKAFC